MRVDHLDHLDQLSSDGQLLARLVDDADLDARVPGLDWDVRTVATHTGAVHRWAADLVRRALPTNETGGSKAFWPDELSDTDLSAWLADGLAALLDTLRDAPVDLACFTFVDGIAPRDFWHRRQAHETAVHRADVEAAVLGSTGVTAFATDFAQDGLAELIGGFATEPGFAGGGGGSLLFRATDGPAWRIAFGGERNVVTAGAAADLEPVDAEVSATSSDLYLWAWNRPVEVACAGDAAVIGLWRQVRVR